MIGAADSAEQRSAQPVGRREIRRGYCCDAAVVALPLVSRLMCGAGNGQRVRASQDALIEVVRALEQQLWMVRAQRAH